MIAIDAAQVPRPLPLCVRRQYPPRRRELDPPVLRLRPHPHVTPNIPHFGYPFQLQRLGKSQSPLSQPLARRTAHAAPQVSYCPALSSLVCFCLRVGFLEGEPTATIYLVLNRKSLMSAGETAAIVQASIDSCAHDLGVLSIGRASHVAFARGLYLAIRQCVFAPSFDVFL